MKLVLNKKTVTTILIVIIIAIRIMEDIMNLTEQEIADWRVRYYKSTEDIDLTLENLEKIIPLSPDAYDKKYGQDNQEIDFSEEEEINLRTETNNKINEYSNKINEEISKLSDFLKTFLIP